MQKRGSKPVVYFDQNWLSEIARAQTIVRSNQSTSFFRLLSSAIHRGVSEGKMVCPTSTFHRSESSFSTQLRAPLLFVAEWFSRGLTFNSWVPINHNQLVRASLEFVGLDFSLHPWWQVPFNRSPDATVQFSQVIKNEEHPIAIDYSVEHRSLRDGKQTSNHREFKKDRVEAGLSYKDEVEYGRHQIFRELHQTPVEAMTKGRLTTSDWELLYQVIGLQAFTRFTNLVAICNQGKGIGAFLSSSQFADAAFLSICAKLRAADIVHYPDREPEPSLIDDFQIAATVLPYSDLYATENYIAHLIKQTKLDQEYGCRVFTMKQKQVFLDELQSMLHT